MTLKVQTGAMVETATSSIWSWLKGFVEDKIIGKLQVDSFSFLLLNPYKNNDKKKKKNLQTN